MLRQSLFLDSQPRRILVRGVNWLGDAVMTTPALLRLREYFSKAHITLLTSEKLADLWLKHASLNDLVSFSPGESPWAVAQRIRSGNYDLAIVLPNSPRSALEVWLAGIPRRLGYARSWRNWLLTHRVAPRPGVMRMRKLSQREVYRRVRSRVADQKSTIASPDMQSSRHHQLYDFLHLVACLGADPDPLAPKVEITADEVLKAETIARSGLATLTSAGLRGPPVWLGLSPSAAYGPAKCWPIENFAAAMDRLTQTIPDSVWLVFGGREDFDLCARIAKQSGGRVINLAGATSLRALMGLLKLCRVLLTNDSGPMHVAAALGTPVVVPFGSTSPELTGPGLPGDNRHHLLTCHAPCSPCFRRTCPIDFRCMTGITVEVAVKAVLSTVKRKSP